MGGVRGRRSEGAREGGVVIFLGYPQNVKIGCWNFFALGQILTSNRLINIP